MPADDPHLDPGASSGGRRASWRPWVVMGVVLVGSYLVVLNTTVLGVALPDISRDLGGASAIGVDWVITVYLLAVVGVQPLTAWLADRWGQRTLYLASLAVFAAGSVLAAIAPTLPALLAARAVQGAGGGALMPLGMAMVLAVFPPHRRGLVLGIRGVAVMAGPALGPPIGGLLVTAGSWRLIFWALLPIAVLALALGATLLRDPGARDHRPLDLGGWLLAFAGIGLVVVGARQAGAWGFASAETIVAVVGGSALLAALVRRSLRRQDPLIEMRLFAVPAFGISIAMVWLVTVVQFARLNFLPVELQVLRDLTAAEVGLILAPAAVGVAITMPAGGWLADRIGARIPSLAGLAVMGVTTWQLSQLTPQTPVWEITAVLLVQGLGTGLMRIPLNVAGMNALPNRYITQGAALRSLNRQVAGALGTAVLAAVVIVQVGTIAPDVTTAEEVASAQAAYNRVFLLASVLVVPALAGAAALPGRRQMRDLQAQRAAEYDAEQ